MLLILAKALSRVLARKNEDMPWPSMDYKMDKLTNHLLMRASESSAIYQMYGYLCDVAVLDKYVKIQFLVKGPVHSEKSCHNLSIFGKFSNF
jgi:hypothetical protein